VLKKTVKKSQTKSGWFSSIFNGTINCDPI